MSRPWRFIKMTVGASRKHTTIARYGQRSTEYTGKHVLNELPRGAYTTVRTFGKHSVFQLNSHMLRMAQSCELLAGDDSTLPKELSDPERLTTLVQDTMASAITAFGKGPDEYKLTVLATWDSVAGDVCSIGATEPGQQNYDVYCHCQPLSYSPPAIVKLEARTSARENALAKDSKWVEQRRGLEELQASDCEEVLLADKDGNIAEGSQSNFFAIDRSTGDVVTAGDGILEGTVRGVLLQVCADDGIGVRFKPPSLIDARDGQWAGCAISSTSRLFLPADLVTVPEDGKTVEETGGELSCQVFASSKVLPKQDLGPYESRCEHLAARVREEVAKNSVQLPGLAHLAKTKMASL